jgi:hypothetical protein
MTSKEQKAAKLKVIDTEIIDRLQEGKDVFSNRGCLVKIKKVDIENALAGFWTRLSEGDKEYDFGSRLANTRLNNKVCLEVLGQPKSVEWWFE